MDEQAVRSALRQYIDSADPDVAHGIYAADAVLEFPQSGERLDGVANFKEWRARYPAQVGYDLRRLRAHGLIARIAGTHRYRLTDTGADHAMLLTPS